ncbi:MAG: hypothetical protein IKM73_14710 [Acidaminococcaceae bacterium]|nr:hypothetical protein [Acidaminococcaceae bacterium]
MVHAPFSSSDSRFDLAQDLSADIADRPAEFRHGGGSVPVQHLDEVLPAQLRIQPASGLDAVGDAGGGSLPEGSSDAEIIIVHQGRTVHAVANVAGVIPPPGQGLLLGDLLDLLNDAHGRVSVILVFQHLPHWLQRVL